MMDGGFDALCGEITTDYIGKSYLIIILIKS